jgi:hypothetical protein
MKLPEHGDYVTFAAAEDMPHGASDHLHLNTKYRVSLRPREVLLVADNGHSWTVENHIFAASKWSAAA